MSTDSSTSVASAPLVASGASSSPLAPQDEKQRELVKVLSASEVHHDYPYVEGLNLLDRAFDADPKEDCSHNGLYYTWPSALPKFLPWGAHLREVTLPADARTLEFPDKGRCDKLILGQRKWPLNKRETVERFNLEPVVVASRFPAILAEYTPEELCAMNWNPQYDAESINSLLSGLCLAQIKEIGKNRVMAMRVVEARIAKSNYTNKGSADVLNYLLTLHPDENWDALARISLMKQPFALRMVPYLRKRKQLVVDVLSENPTLYIGRLGKFILLNDGFVDILLDGIEAFEQKEDAPVVPPSVAPAVAAVEAKADQIATIKGFEQIKADIEAQRETWVAKALGDTGFLTDTLKSLFESLVILERTQDYDQLQFVWEAYFEFALGVRSKLPSSYEDAIRQNWVNIYTCVLSGRTTGNWLMKSRALCPSNVISCIHGVLTPESQNALKEFLIQNGLCEVRAKAESFTDRRLFLRAEFHNLKIRAQRYKEPLAYSQTSYSVNEAGELFMHLKNNRGIVCCLLIGPSASLWSSSLPLLSAPLFVTHEQYSEISIP